MRKGKEAQRPYFCVPHLLESTHGDLEKAGNGYIPCVESEAETLKSLPSEYCRDEIQSFPNLAENEVVRHFTQLSQLNYSIDTGFYPLGSCTMKYNPKVNEQIAAMEGFTNLHPSTPEHLCQGALELMFHLQEALKKITGLKGCSLHPAAGAQGELTGVKMISAYHRVHGNGKRDTIIIPDSAHGTNPASAALSGFKVKQLKTGEKGIVDSKDVRALMDDSIAGLMITVPNTLGIFEKNILEVAKIVREGGGLVYCDGANLNALVGQVDFCKMGVDVMHINLHKTFSTPHGGGGPGSGPVVVSDRLVDYLPIPTVIRAEGGFSFDYEIKHTVGKFRAFYGNFGMLVRALCYIYAFGHEDIRKISEIAVLNANYIRSQLCEVFHLPFDSPTMHEVVFSDKWQEKEAGVTTLDIAKRLMDYGLHPPTIYFPLVVQGALMIEPTESEPKEELDHFIEAMKRIAQEAKTDPDKVKSSPHNLIMKRLDETAAARNPILSWHDEEK